MTYLFRSLQTALDVALARRQAWERREQARDAEDQGFDEAVEKCFETILKPGMQKVHTDVVRVGYYAPYSDEVIDGVRTLTLSLFPHQTGAGRKGSMTVRANRPQLRLDIEINVDEHTVDAPQVHRKPANLDSEQFEGELVKLINLVMIFD